MTDGSPASERADSNDPQMLPGLAQQSGNRTDFWHYCWGWCHMVLGSLMRVLYWGETILVIVPALRWPLLRSTHQTRPVAFRN
jgi:hypothetical protein